MNRTKNIAVITMGYNTKFALEDPADALQLMALMSKAVALDDHTYGMGEQPFSFYLAEEGTMPELKFVPAHLFNTQETTKEAKERLAREKADREDMDQQFREAPVALAAPVASTVVGEHEFF